MYKIYCSNLNILYDYICYMLRSFVYKVRFKRYTCCRTGILLMKAFTKYNLFNNADLQRRELYISNQVA